MAEGVRQRASEMADDYADQATDQAIRSGIDAFRNDAQHKADQLFADAYGRVPANLRVDVSNTLNALKDPPLHSTPRLHDGLVQVRRGVQSKLRWRLDGKLRFDALSKLERDFRPGIPGSPAVRDVPPGQLENFRHGLMADLRASASASGADAAQALRRAEAYQRAAQNRMKVLGDLAQGSDASAAIFKLVTSGYPDQARDLQNLLKALPDSARRTLVANVMDRMGRSPEGRNEFSVDTFIKNWSAMHPEAQRTLFQTLGNENLKDAQAYSRVVDNLRKGSPVYAGPPKDLPYGDSLLWATAVLAGAAARPESALRQLEIATAGVVASAGLAAGMTASKTPVKYLAGGTEPLWYKPEKGESANLVQLAESARDDAESN